MSIERVSGIDPGVQSQYHDFWIFQDLKLLSLLDPPIVQMERTCFGKGEESIFAGEMYPWYGHDVIVRYSSI